MTTSLTLTEKHVLALRQHLFPTDGCEAVALLLCGRRRGEQRHRLLVQRVVPIPYDECIERTPDRVTWPTNRLEPLLMEAEKRDLAIVKIHGHRGLEKFSMVDDAADRELFPSIYAWTDNGPHGSAIMLEDGPIFGRVVTAEGEFIPLSHVNIAGDDLMFWHSVSSGVIESFGQRIAQAFGAGTYDRLRKLRIGVVGCSGTGSPVVEQLARNCVGELVLVDPDHVEDKNLNRIINSTAMDAANAMAKVDVLARAINAMGLGTKVETYEQDLFHPEVVRALASCDILFGCMDSVDGRHLLNKLATFYLIPYFDLGVKLEADGSGGVDQVCGSVHFLKPGSSSLLSRHVYSMEQVRAAGLYRTDREAYERERREGYLHGVAENRPAVIQLNMLIASMAVNELLARLHPYRLDSNEEFAINRISLSHGIFEHLDHGEPCPTLERHLGRGDVYPLLDSAELSERKAAA